MHNGVAYIKFCLVICMALNLLSLVCGRVERKKDLNNIIFKTVGSISRLHFTHTRIACDQIRRNLIFAFILEIRPILFPHTLLWGVLGTPNQHFLVAQWVIRVQISMLKYSSSNPTQDTIFLCTSHPYFGQSFYLVCRYLVTH